MTRGVLIGAAALGTLAVLAGMSGWSGTPVSEILLASGVVAALTLSRAPRGE